MSIQNLMTNDLIRIAAAGGGFRLDCKNRMTDDLIRIAAASQANNCTLIFSGMGMRLVDDLIRIGAASGGNVIFED